jgi:hypothetical protein
MHPGAEKNFIGVKVPDAGDQLLVEQNRLHCAAVFAKDRFKLREINFERVRTKGTCSQKIFDILDQLDLAKFPLIVERQATAVRETKNHARSFRRYIFVF